MERESLHRRLLGAWTLESEPSAGAERQRKLVPGNMSYVPHKSELAAGVTTDEQGRLTPDAPSSSVHIGLSVLICRPDELHWSPELGSRHQRN